MNIDKIKKAIICLLIFLFCSSVVFATDHYSFEHAEEMKNSGRIDWRDYGSDAFQEAIDENKPIFLLLTAPSWCYWCHVYTSDEYIYHETMYPVINQDFIPIYVDADKRQDLTRQYLEGGWPSTTVFTPQRERLFGYSGPRPLQFMLQNMQNAVNHVNTIGFSADIRYDYKESPVIIPTDAQLNSLITGFASFTLQAYDSQHGGFGSGQKFPQGRTLDFALEWYKKTKDARYLELVQNTLQNQYTNSQELTTNYNLFDPIEGGFHRYGTKRDWTPPHYEKMLYDNVRLLKAYYRLLQLNPDNKIAQEVVTKTINFIDLNWYDEKGGFYGNSDVHGEDKYYGKINRPADKPRVEQSKYTDWNSEAILTYLFLYQTEQGKRFKEMAENSLDFFEKEMVSPTGAYHYYKDNTKKVRGNLLDNAYLLLAFVEGYEVLGKKSYLNTAKQLADYTLNNLYDWNSGGFFERNSPDVHLYAPGEHINLGKPQQENGVITYALVKLYKQTNNPLYLNAAVKTFGSKLNSIGGLDSNYYYIKAAQFMVDNNLIQEFNQINVAEEEKQQQENFWLIPILNNKFVESQQGLQKLQGPIILLMVVALLAGLISFGSPCTLPILPAYTAYMFRSSKQKIQGMTLSFLLGLSVVFTGLGMSATAIGNLLKSNSTLFAQIAGTIIIIFGLYILFGKGIPGLHFKPTKPRSYFGSFVFGAAFSLSWSACVGPILLAILVLAATTSSVYTGGLLLFMYALGVGLPLVVASAYFHKIDQTGRFWRFIKGKEIKFNILNKKVTIHTNALISGLLFVILGILIFSGTLYTFNQYVVTTNFQGYIFKLEEWLLHLVS